MADHLFTYGSLMFAPVWQRIVRVAHARAPAHVDGLARFAVANEAYPGCVFAEQARTDGVVYFDLAPHELAALDQFEGEHYARAKVLATDERGRSFSAWTYIYLLPQKLLSTPWSPDEFEANGMARFITQYQPTRR
jgi:gamma-glutamylcyclotransferase (GGCT)/AIG2-like uncharacterized protein YtfP